MEPPSAAAYFFHLKFSLLRSALFIFICIPERSSSRIFPFKKKPLRADVHTHVHTAMSSLRYGYERKPCRPCADYGAISV